MNHILIVTAGVSRLIQLQPSQSRLTPAVTIIDK